MNKGTAVISIVERDNKINSALLKMMNNRYISNIIKEIAV